MIDTNPHLVNREFVVATALLAAIFLLSSLLDTPLRERANPSFSPNPAKAPWYFMGLQELLIHFHPVSAVVVIPVTVLAAAIWFPYIKRVDANQGIWFLSDRGLRSAKISPAAGAVFTVLFIGLSELFPDPGMLIPAVPPLITTGLVPFIIVTFTMWLFLKFIGTKLVLNGSETVQSIIVLMITSYTILTVAGIFLRGEWMNLMLPWRV
ncbi:MAG: hypothetical protein WAV93_10100 [Bacteroidales bacterium]